MVHLTGLALALWGVCRAFRRFFSASDLIVPVMATGIVINLAAYMFSIVPITWFDTREIPSVLPFGAVLAGRLLAEPRWPGRMAAAGAGRRAGLLRGSPSDTESRSPRSPTASSRSSRGSRPTT